MSCVIPPLVCGMKYSSRNGVSAHLVTVPLPTDNLSTPIWAWPLPKSVYFSRLLINRHVNPQRTAHRDCRIRFVALEHIKLRFLLPVTRGLLSAPGARRAFGAILMNERVAVRSKSPSFAGSEDISGPIWSTFRGLCLMNYSTKKLRTLYTLNIFTAGLCAWDIYTICSAELVISGHRAKSYYSI